MAIQVDIRGHKICLLRGSLPSPADRSTCRRAPRWTCSKRRSLRWGNSCRSDNGLPRGKASLKQTQLESITTLQMKLFYVMTAFKRIFWSLKANLCVWLLLVSPVGQYQRGWLPGSWGTLGHLDLTGNFLDFKKIFLDFQKHEIH